MAQTQTLHRTAARGFAAGADSYVRGRPDYPAEIDGWLKGTIGLGPGTHAVDLGAGTGKFTARLVATGTEVVAVEPIDEMRARLTTALPQVRALIGTADAIPLPDASADAVLCALSFHWFANAAALNEIHRVLKPGGRLGLIWNMRDERVDWVARLGQLVARHEGDAPRAYKGDWKTMFPAPGFGPLARADFPHGHSGPPEEVIVTRALSTSFVAALPSAERESLVEEVRALIAAEPELAGKAVVTVPHVTTAYSAVRL